MKTGKLSSYSGHACLVCRKKNTDYKTYEQFGVEIQIPVCPDHYHSIDAKAEADRVSRVIRAQAEAARQPVTLQDDWAGARKMEHYCHEPFSSDTRHTFWIPQLITDNGVVAVGNVADGDDQRADCMVATARFTTASAAQAFAEDYRDQELGKEKGA